MTKQSLVNADDAIKSFSKYSSLSEGIYQALIAKPHEIARLVRIAIDPQSEHITQTHYPLIVCQLLQNYPYLLLVLFSVEGNADSLFQFLERSPNSTQLGYFTKIVSLFNSSTQEEALRYLKENQKIVSLCFNNIHISAVFRFLFDCTILCKKENEFRSVILMKLYKEIILQPSCEELAVSIKQTLAELIQNYSMLGPTLKQTICNIFDEEYVKEVLNIVFRNQNHCISQSCIGILSRIVVVRSKIKAQHQHVLKTQSIQKGIVEILKKLKVLSGLLLSQPKKTHLTSHNETIPDMTMMKLKLSEFFKIVVNYIDQPQLQVHGLKLVDLLQIVISQMSVNPWANLVHNQLTDIALTIIEKHESWDENIVDLLNQLMQLFKNRFYIYLNSGKTITLGNTHHLYLIIKKLSLVLDQRQQLQDIFKNVRPWKKFLTEDVQRYEENLKINTETYPRAPQDVLQQPSVSNLIVKINQRSSNELISQFLDDLNDSYVEVVNYTVWDKKRQSNKQPGK